MEIYELTIKEISQLIKKKEISPVEITGQILNRIERYDSEINSYVTVLSDYAIDKAKKAEEDIYAGNYLGPLHGIPFGLKDIFNSIVSCKVRTGFRGSKYIISSRCIFSMWKRYSNNFSPNICNQFYSILNSA